MSALAHDIARARVIRRQLDIIEARQGKILPFTRHTKPDYEINWHHTLTARYIDAFIQKKIRFLIVLQPPRHGKSELTSRRLPALIHGLYPNDEILAASYNDTTASDFTIDVQRIMDQPEYREIFPRIRIPASTAKGYARSSSEHEILPWQDPATRLWEWHRGSYNSAGVLGSFTSKGANWLLIDDPIKNRSDADSPAYRNSLWKNYRSSMRSRLEKGGSILITVTRWHEDDLVGRILEQMRLHEFADQFVVLKLPAIRTDFDFPLDPRALGEALWPSKYSIPELLSLKTDEREWAALYQQSPTIEGGNIIKRDQIRFYKVEPTYYDREVLSWDLASSGKATSDYYVGKCYAKLGANIYLRPDERRGQWTFPFALDQFKDQINMFPEATAKLVENKANGPAMIETLRDEIQGLIPIEPRGDKVARLNAVAPLYQAGNVWYPDPSICPWIEEHISEMCGFPNAKNDDRVDAESQALDYLRSHGELYAPVAGHSE